MSSDLTPEERQNIYEEEKARAEARDKIAADKKAEAEKAEGAEAVKTLKVGGIGCLVFLAFCFLLTLLIESLKLL